MTPAKVPGSGWVLGAITCLGFAIALALAFPARATYDSMFALLEGRLHVFSGLQPPWYGAVLASLDAFAPGFSTYTVLQTALYYLAISLLIRRSRTSVPLVFAVAFASISPLTVLYQGVVWKDVLYCNLAVIAFSLLDAWKGKAERLPMLVLALMLALFSAAVRTNGAIVFGALAAFTFHMRPQRPIWTALLVGIAGTVVALALTGAGDRVLADRGGLERNLTPILIYDIAGIVANSQEDESGRTDAFISTDMVKEIREKYSPLRWDYLWSTSSYYPAMSAIDFPSLRGVWIDLVKKNPGAYIKHRLAVFRELISPSSPAACLPIAVGIDDVGDLNLKTNLIPRLNSADSTVGKVALALAHTPLWQHWTYLLVGTIVVLLIGGSGGSRLAMTVIVSGLAFGFSWLLIGVSCDYRYLYYSDVAVVIGTLIALRPRSPNDAESARLL